MLYLKDLGLLALAFPSCSFTIGTLKAHDMCHESARYYFFFKESYESQVKMIVEFQHLSCGVFLYLYREK